MTEKQEKKEAPHPKNNKELEEILSKIPEIGGPKHGTTKFGDWSNKGRVSDF
ncbi:MAG: DUF1674 domain-containing protein [Rickettsiales bacterium]|nr:DUF1674 domain-containing protein [Rickettsiales bacterium]